MVGKRALRFETMFDKVVPAYPPYETTKLMLRKAHSHFGSPVEVVMTSKRMLSLLRDSIRQSLHALDYPHFNDQQ